MSAQPTEAPQPASNRLKTPGLSLVALGVVFGDIGTSPLYTLKTTTAASATVLSLARACSSSGPRPRFSDSTNALRLAFFGCGC